VDRCRKKQKNQLSCVIVNQDARRVLTVPESIQIHSPTNSLDLPLNFQESSPLERPIIQETTEAASDDEVLAPLSA
jgi:hypothetical protein